METLLLPVIHVTILVALLVYFLKSPFIQFMRDRHTTTTEGLNKSKAQVAEAESKRKEIEQKLSTLSSEKALIFKEWKEQELLQIKAIQESSARILAQMSNEAANNKVALEEFTKRDTVRGLALVVVEQVKKKINEKLNPELHRKINDKFSQEVAGA